MTWKQTNSKQSSGGPTWLMIQCTRKTWPWTVRGTLIYSQMSSPFWPMLWELWHTVHTVTLHSSRSLHLHTSASILLLLNRSSRKRKVLASSECQTTDRSQVHDGSGTPRSRSTGLSLRPEIPTSLSPVSRRPLLPCWCRVKFLYSFRKVPAF